MIRRLTIENFRGIERLDLQLNEGIVLITGPNGSGKSSICDAIAWVLVDHYSPSLKLIRRKGSSYMRVSIEMDGLPKIIKSNGNRGTNLVVEGMAFKNLTEAQNWLIEQIGVDKSLFLNSIYLRQRSEIDMLLSSSEAKKTLMKLFDLNKWEEYYYIARTKIVEIERELDSITHALSDKSIEDLERELNQIGEQINQLGGLRLDEMIEKSRLQNELQDLRIRLAEYQDLPVITDDEVRQLDATLEVLQRKVAEIEAELRSVEKDLKFIMQHSICPLCKQEIRDRDRLKYELRVRRSRLAQQYKMIAHRLEEAMDLHKEIQEHVRKQREAEEIKDRISKIEQRLAQLKSVPLLDSESLDRYRQLMVRYAELEMKIRDVKLRSDRIDELKSQLELLKILRDAYSKDGIPKMILRSALRKLEYLSLIHI